MLTKKTKYYSIHGYQDGNANIVEINCSAEQYAMYEENKIARIHASVILVTDNFTKEKKFYIKQLNNHMIKTESDKKVS